MAGVGDWYQAGHCQDIDGFLNHSPGMCEGAILNCSGLCCGPKHLPKDDGTCSLLCTCPTPLTDEEAKLLGDLGIF